MYLFTKQVMWGYPEVLEIDKLYTNDTHQVAKTYGIEAAGRVIATVSSQLNMEVKS